MYVAIEGPIGVGKTSLAPWVARALGAELVLEEVEENAFLPSFYQDRPRYAFQTQVAFLLSRFCQQQRIHQATGPVVSDYLLAKDRIFAAINLDQRELALYQDLWQILSPRTPRPDLIVMLRAPVDLLLERIRKRGRPYERSISRSYLREVSRQYQHQFVPENEGLQCPMLVVDTATFDPVGREADRAALLAAIHDHRQGIHTFEPLGSRQPSDRDGGQ